MDINNVDGAICMLTQGILDCLLIVLSIVEVLVCKGQSYAQLHQDCPVPRREISLPQLAVN